MTAKTAKTKKAKGSRLEHKVAEKYRRFKIDETARRMPLSGAMSHFKGDIYKRYDFRYVDECKNHETVRLSTFWQQTIDQCGMGVPVLHVSGNYRPIVTIMREADFDELTDGERFEIIDITAKKRFNFWDYASKCTNFDPFATVVYVATSDEALVIMDLDVYCKLRQESENPA